jgi:hypothetical protein
VQPAVRVNPFAVTHETVGKTSVSAPTRSRARAAKNCTGGGSSVVASAQIRPRPAIRRAGPPAFNLPIPRPDSSIEFCHRTRSCEWSTRESDGQIKVSGVVLPLRPS